MRKIIIIVLALATTLGFVFWRFGPKIGNNNKDENKPTTLLIYGLWEDENYIKPAIEAYKKVKPNVTLKYVFQSSINYQKRVQTQISSNEGPDVFMLHQTWVPGFIKANLLSPMPSGVMSLEEYTQAFNPVAVETLTQDNKIYGIARGIDGLALYYNEDILKAVNASVPQTWEEFRNSAIKTTTKDPAGNIITAGAAMGATGNVDHWPDIIGLLFLQQPGASLEKPNSDAGAEIIRFYTNFVTKPSQKVWDVNLENSTQAFAAGKLAFYFAPSWRAHEIHETNKDLHFNTASVPQLPNKKKISWSTVWAYAVSSKSQNQTQAWEFLKFFTSSQTQKLLYQEASKLRLFGLPYSRVELQKELEDDPIVGAFVIQAPDYKSWYLASQTHDQGVNDQMIKYFEDAINATLQGADPKSALDTTAKGVEQVLNTFVNPATPAPSKR
ncbi:sugar ABC transporter substrate-binding protein [Candidatus Daviesbacteria bacterium]|nr:sugar ABC transporter substrate-binding protein [Candidatus Daviesbacteria bacterium]